MKRIRIGCMMLRRKIRTRYLDESVVELDRYHWVGQLEQEPLDYAHEALRRVLFHVDIRTI